LEKLKRKDHLGYLGKMGDNIKEDLEEIGYNDEDWTQDRNLWWDLNSAMNIRFP
jgi:hypothetical protein